MNEKHVKKVQTTWSLCVHLMRHFPLSGKMSKQLKSRREKNYEVRAYLNTNFNDMACMRKQKAHLL